MCVHVRNALEENVFGHMALSNGSYNQVVLGHWKSSAEKIISKSNDVLINGRNIDLAAVVAVAR